MGSNNQTGINDALVCLFFSVFLYANNLFLGSIYVVRYRVGGSDENRPKGHVWCHLGHRCIFFFSFCVFYILTILLYLDYLCYEDSRRARVGRDDTNGPK